MVFHVAAGVGAVVACVEPVVAVVPLAPEPLLAVDFGALAALAMTTMMIN